MDPAAWLGLALGTTIGGLYVWTQSRELDGRERQRRALLFPPWGPVVRVVVLVFALVTASSLTGANRYWLAGSVAVIYGAWFPWMMRRLLCSGK